MIPLNGRKGIVGTDLAEIVFTMPEDLPPYLELSEKQLGERFTMLGGIGYRMVLIYSAILLEPETAALVDDLLRTCASMIRDELQKEQTHSDVESEIDKLRKQWEVEPDLGEST